MIDRPPLEDPPTEPESDMIYEEEINREERAKLKLRTEITSAELMRTDLPPVNFIVDNLIPDGLTILGAKPKAGKSWFALQLALAISTGSIFLDKYPCKKGAVLYLALEDNFIRLKSRMEMLGAEGNELLTFQVARLKGNKAGYAYIANWAEQHKGNAKLIVVDTLVRFKEKPKGRPRGMYDEDTETLAPLHNFSSKYGIASLVVHHQKKQKEDDWADNFSGSQGITGVVDTMMLLNRKDDENTATMRIKGRDIQESTLDLMFNPTTYWWELCNDKADFIINGYGKSSNSDESLMTVQIIKLLRDRPTSSLSLPEITDSTGRDKRLVHRCLKKLQDMDIVEQLGGHGSPYRYKNPSLF